MTRLPPPFRWGVFGTGDISYKFVAGLRALQNTKAVAVVSRSLERADIFARGFNIPYTFEDYPSAATKLHGIVDAVYIATPPAFHHEHAIACLEADLPVLIEKPFSNDASSARAIAEAARKHRLFCMEAMWTRFLPALSRMRLLILNGAIGEPRLVSGSFGLGKVPDPQNGNFDPNRGGGALAHLGVYPLSLGQWLFGNPVSTSATGRVGESGVEEDAAIALEYPQGVTGCFHTSIRALAQNDFRVSGTHGQLSLRGPIYRPWGLDFEKVTPRPLRSDSATSNDLRRESHLFSRLSQIRDFLGRRTASTERHFFSGNGYHYEAQEVAECIRAGLLESAVMPLSDSVDIIDSMTGLRASIFAGAR